MTPSIQVQGALSSAALTIRLVSAAALAVTAFLHSESARTGVHT